MAKAKTRKADPWKSHKKTLAEKRDELLEVYDKDRAALAEHTDDGIQDLADRAANAYARELNFSLSDVERNTLIRIEEAFDRMEEGIYGFCTNCEQKIGEKRLKAVPWTPLCIDCAELAENGLLEVSTSSSSDEEE
ncbi:MAG: TraR/DksA C4-type zinc finger protein [Acidobacteria bacterium]|nr:TraR/DksA C4-type zinc finger protein [Acidobacteriota bacterium]